MTLVTASHAQSPKFAHAEKVYEWSCYNPDSVLIGRAKILYREGNLLEAAVELLISFRLDAARLKQYELEFPTLATLAEFERIDELIRGQLGAKETPPF